jgi:hypothetical protein
LKTVSSGRSLDGSTIQYDLPELERAVQAMAETLSAEHQQDEDPPAK